jgi:hypothetical protein
MEKSETIKRILEDPDFIHAPKHQNSLQKYVARMENPCENNVIGRLLMLPPDKVEEIYQESIIELRKAMDTDGDSSI